MPIETEPNGLFATANPMALGVAATGALSSNTDIDIFRYSVAAAGVVSLVFDVPSNSSLDYFQLGLYSSTGSQLALFSTGQDKTFQTAVQAGGDYYLGAILFRYEAPVLADAAGAVARLDGAR